MQSVDRVVIPGMEGVYGVTAGHTPIVAEMKPGVVNIVHTAVGGRTGARWLWLADRRTGGRALIPTSKAAAPWLGCVRNIGC